MCVTTSQYKISGKNSHLHSQKVFVQSMIYQRKQFIGTSSILAWGKSSFSCLPTATFLHYVSTIKLSDQSSIVRCCCCFFCLIFALFLFSFISHYLKKLSMDAVHDRGSMDPDHGPLSWIRSVKVVHVPGPKWGSMDPWSMFCPHSLNNGYKNSLNMDAIFFVLYLTAGDWGFFRSDLPLAYPVQRSNSRLNFHIKHVWRWTVLWFALVCW